MRTVSYFQFVLREVAAVALATALATAIYGAVEPEVNLLGLLLASGWVGAFSIFYSALPVLVGGLLVVLAANTQPDRFRFWSIFFGIFAAAGTYGLLLVAAPTLTVTTPSLRSLVFFALLITPSLWAWQRLANKYLRRGPGSP